MGSLDPQSEYDVVVIGGGFSGMYQLYHLRKFGFSVHLFEAGSELGGTWFWNCYDGARVDTEIPVYQFTDDETWDSWNWTQRYPDRNEIQGYFKHVSKVWDLDRDVSYNSSIVSVVWDDSAKLWLSQVAGDQGSVHRSKFVVLCTGFASKPYIPKFKNLDNFKGELYHTARWPLKGLSLQGKRVGIVGTGASGVQMVQSASKVASHLTVFQRTPNLALPMGQENFDETRNKRWKSSFEETRQKIKTTYAGFTYDFTNQFGANASEKEKILVFESLYNAGGLNFWLGNFKDMFEDRETNNAAYQFWREKTLPRIKKTEYAAILAPETPPHPFGAKRVSLEQGFFEVFNNDNVHLVDLATHPIEEFTTDGVKTKDGITHILDVVVLATGFDAITGSITTIDIRGINGTPLKEKWRNGTYTHLGMTTSGYPNMFFVYGPQAPTAFATGPASAEAQGEWILECLRYMRREHLRTINATKAAEVEWHDHVNDMTGRKLIAEVDSWYFGGNIPGKPKEALNYMAGMPMYKEKIWNCAKSGYTGFLLQ